MGLDQLLDLTSAVSYKVLPILGVVSLIFLIIFLRHLCKLMKESMETVKSMKHTIDLTSQQLDLLGKPLNTLNALSETVDNVHEASKHAVRSAFVAIMDNFSVIKDWAFKTKSKEDSDIVNTNRSDDDASEQ